MNIFVSQNLNVNERRREKISNWMWTNCLIDHYSMFTKFTLQIIALSPTLISDTSNVLHVILYCLSQGKLKRTLTIIVIPLIDMIMRVGMVGYYY